MKRIVRRKKDEMLLRHWLKDAMGADVNWIEPTFGSTVGMPDSSIRIDKQRFPVELKAWKRIKGQIKAEMRPAQIRYHFMAARHGEKTAIMYLVMTEKGFDVFLLPGKYVPMGDKKIDESKALYIGSEHTANNRALIIKTLSSSSFWET